MSKKDKNSMAEDYLRQVEWENTHQVDRSGHAPWKDAPKWKYKRSYGASKRKSKDELHTAIIWGMIVISIFGYLIFQIFIGHNGNGIFISILVLILLAFPYFMTRPPK
jgi:hypothetical protein